MPFLIINAKPRCSLRVQNIQLPFETQHHFVHAKRKSCRVGWQQFPAAFSHLCLLLPSWCPAPLQQSIHPLLQPSSLWWVSCHCLSLQLWTQLPEPDGPISTSSSLSHGVYKGASEPEATADWPRSVEISLSQNNMPREVEKNCLQCNSQRGTTQTDNVAFIVLECKYVFSTWLRFD